METITRPPVLTAIGRGLMCRCPACGKGKLFRAYLKQVERCSVCGTRYGHMRADDAPPWLTILVVGHIVVPLAFWVERDHPLPDWVSMTFWPALALALTLLFLPLAKGLFIGVLLATGAPGSEEQLPTPGRP
jgi:uncharacterized protein (DUF983 family)